MAVDYFKALGEERRPWLDPEALRRKFISLSTTCHPDKTSTLNAETPTLPMSELNAAYNCLRDHPARLRHLLSLQNGNGPSELQEIPAALMERFLEVGNACRSADKVAAASQAAQSPMLKAQLFASGLEHIKDITALQQRLVSEQDTLLAELRRLDSVWINSRTTEEQLSLDPALERTYRLLSYYKRWLTQLGERLTRLAY